MFFFWVSKSAYSTHDIPRQALNHHSSPEMAEQVRDFEKTVVCFFSHGTSGGLRTHKKNMGHLTV